MQSAAETQKTLPLPPKEQHDVMPLPPKEQQAMLSPQPTPGQPQFLNIDGPPPPPKHMVDITTAPYPAAYSVKNGNASAQSLPIPRQGSPRSPTPSNTAGSTRSSSVLDVSVLGQSGDQLLDHSHLKPGANASLLSYNQTINMYRENAKKTNSPDIQCDFAIFLVEAAKPVTDDDTTRWEYLTEAEKLLRQLASRGHAESQYYLGNLYASGLLSKKGKNEFDKAFPLFVQATKHHHADAAYRAAKCYEDGLGTRRDSSKAVQFYR